MFEQEIQEHFFSFITGREKIINASNNRIDIYKDLVFYRFHEVLKNVYPVFKKKIGDELFDFLIRSFIQDKPQYSFIWKMPDEFRHFCLNSNKFSEFSFVKDILWYEWTEVELLMGNYLKNEITPFSWDHSFKLSESTRLSKLTHRVYMHDFQVTTLFNTFNVILYYNFQEHKVYFQEITSFMLDLIDSMGQKSALAALSETASRYNVKMEESADIIINMLNEFCHKKILVRI
ncbi:MAG: DNA-binding domain-containing protein [Spirochaetia bacterium]|nr:DNA-binding domain-containing protein [Spirochaetia bacterium]